jgi:hypothetical protein
MTEQEILRAAASIKGKRSWKKKVKQLGGKKAAAEHMKSVRAGKRVINSPAV